MERLTRRRFLAGASAAGMAFMLGIKVKLVDLSSCYGTGTYGNAVYGGRTLHHHRF